ncbi:hypothetical protein DNTS_014164 [Danionella cerebrum]|uniref:Paralemmin n=1 Tax=Danionella cerebrum TaxID=2873325 RepID=A0A553R7W9_9TELE|nr:hypothetical protein DNTS_014164 [Danionella translucida]
MEQEAEKYQQRLQVIARKSLRDQWLMEGPPTSPDSSGPRSPLWGSKAQEIETHINKLQEKSEQLAEEEDKLKKLIEDDAHQHHMQQAEALVQECVRTAVAAMTPNGLVENGKVEKRDDSVQADHHREEPEHGDAERLTTTSSAVLNGEASQSSPGRGESASVNGFSSLPIEGQDGTLTLTFLGFKEAELSRGVDEEEDGGAIIRAERVIITDEGEEVDTDQEFTTDDKNGGDSGSTNIIKDMENNLVFAVDLEELEDVADVEIITDVAIKDEKIDFSNSIDSQTQDLTESSQAPALSTSEPPPTAEEESRGQKEKESMASTRISCSLFQEVPLDESKAGPEQEPLLISKAAQMDTSVPNPGEDGSRAKRKTCKCCSVM